MFSKYNLYVGGALVSDGECFGDDCYTLYGDEATGKQSEYMKEEDSEYLKSEGVTKYSDVGTDYETSIIKGYVDNYTDILSDEYNVTATGSLINEQQLVRLNNYYSDNDISFVSYDNPEGQPTYNFVPWFFSGKYWTNIVGSGKVSDTVLTVDGNFSTSGGIYGGQFYNNISQNFGYGVRPVITVASTLFD